jgi:hypothetical protein
VFDEATDIEQVNDAVQILRVQKGLRDQRKRRQIMAATHYANIPVLGDAELVLALETREGRAQIAGCISIDDPATESWQRPSWKAARKPSSGGRKNMAGCEHGIVTTS